MNVLVAFVIPSLAVLLALMLVSSRRRTARTTYVLTNERAVFLRDGLAQPEAALELREYKPRLIRERGGLGSIVFEPHVVMTDFGGALTNREHGFFGIENAGEVYALVQKAQAALKID